MSPGHRLRGFRGDIKRNTIKRLRRRSDLSVVMWKLRPGPVLFPLGASGNPASSKPQFRSSVPRSHQAEKKRAGVGCRSPGTRNLEAADRKWARKAATGLGVLTRASLWRILYGLDLKSRHLSRDSRDLPQPLPVHRDCYHRSAERLEEERMVSSAND